MTGDHPRTTAVRMAWLPALGMIGSLFGWSETTVPRYGQRSRECSHRHCNTGVAPWLRHNGGTAIHLLVHRRPSSRLWVPFSRHFSKGEPDVI